MNKISVIAVCICLLSSGGFAEAVKEADLAGSWYPGMPILLKHELNAYLEKAQPPKISGEIVAVVSPHAGIAYSGPTAAHSFKVLQGKPIDTVVVVGFSHHLDYDGIAVFDADGVKTPLGTLLTDKDLLKSLTGQHQKILSLPQAFEQENSVELQLVFIQAALDDPGIVLLAMGRQSYENCQILAEALYQALKDRRNYVIVASTDLSHYLPQASAEATDAISANLIEAMEPEVLYQQSYNQNRMCGTGPVVATMIAAQKLGADKAYILERSTSADTSGDAKRVVGYLSAAFVKQNPQQNSKEDKMEQLLTQAQKKRLLKLARDTIALYLTKEKVLQESVDDAGFEQVMGVFVTLHKHGELRGCIGNIVGRVPLYKGVIDMAIASSTQDHRFSPLTSQELEDIDIEISVLSPLKKITDPKEIILGTHGVLVKDFLRSGVYLPQVATETGWSKEEFLTSLCAHKAGMSPDAWKTGKCDIFIFSAEVFGEKDFE